MKPSKSILSQPVIKGLMRNAKCNLERDGHLVSVLIAKVADGQIITIELTDLMTAQTAERKRIRMSILGKGIRQVHRHIREAVLIMEGWYVAATEPGAMDIAPRKHPARQQATCIIGRNDRNTRHSVVVQPFTRNTKNQLVWSDPLIADYNVSTANNLYPFGLLDCLFEEIPAYVSH